MGVSDSRLAQALCDYHWRRNWPLETFELDLASPRLFDGISRHDGKSRDSEGSPVAFDPLEGCPQG